MFRRIETGTVAAAPRGSVLEGPAAAGFAPVPPQPIPDNYLGRLLKYIPAEVVAFYLAAAGLMSPAGSPPNQAGLWAVFFLGFALVPVYFWIATKREGGKPLWPQIILATIAYPVWVFAIGGPFQTLSWYSGPVAGLLLIFVTAVFGMHKPEAGS